jgi:hypothetical protein
MIGTVRYTDGLAFGLSDRMARDLANIGVVASVQDRPAPKPMPEYTAWKPTHSGEQPPF